MFHQLHCLVSSHLPISTRRVPHSVDIDMDQDVLRQTTNPEYYAEQLAEPGWNKHVCRFDATTMASFCLMWCYRALCGSP